MLKTRQLKILKLPLILEHLSDKKDTVIVQKGVPFFKTQFYLKAIVSKAF